MEIAVYVARLDRAASAYFAGLAVRRAIRISRFGQRRNRPCEHRAKLQNCKFAGLQACSPVRFSAIRTLSLHTANKRRSIAARNLQRARSARPLNPSDSRRPRAESMLRGGAMERRLDSSDREWRHLPRDSLICGGGALDQLWYNAVHANARTSARETVEDGEVLPLVRHGNAGTRQVWGLG